MACMEYECRKCGWQWGGNMSDGCPKCKSYDVFESFDEIPEEQDELSNFEDDDD